MLDDKWNMELGAAVLSESEVKDFKDLDKTDDSVIAKLLVLNKFDKILTNIVDIHEKMTEIMGYCEKVIDDPYSVIKQRNSDFTVEKEECYKVINELYGYMDTYSEIGNETLDETHQAIYIRTLYSHIENKEEFKDSGILKDLRLFNEKYEKISELNKHMSETIYRAISKVEGLVAASYY